MPLGDKAPGNGLVEHRHQLGHGNARLAGKLGHGNALALPHGLVNAPQYLREVLLVPAPTNKTRAHCRSHGAQRHGYDAGDRTQDEKAQPHDHQGKRQKDEEGKPHPHAPARPVHVLRVADNVGRLNISAKGAQLLPNVADGLRNRLRDPREVNLREGLAHLPRGIGTSAAHVVEVLLVHP